MNHLYEPEFLMRILGIVMMLSCSVCMFYMITRVKKFSWIYYLLGFLGGAYLGGAVIVICRIAGLV